MGSNNVADILIEGYYMNKSEKKQYEKDKINVSRFYRKERKVGAE